MKKLILMVLLSGSSVFASHPHDRVCVASMKSSNQSNLSFIFQYSMGRTYTSGDPQLDPRDVAAQASYSVGDYLDLPATKFLSVLKTLGPKDSHIISMTLTAEKDAKNVFFSGSFDLGKEVLNGTFTDANGTKTVAKVKLNCISTPAVIFGQAKEDLLEQAPIK